MGYRLFLESLELLNSYEHILCLLSVSIFLKDNQETTLVTLGIIFLAPNIFQTPNTRKASSISLSLQTLIEMESTSMLKPWT